MTLRSCSLHNLLILIKLINLVSMHFKNVYNYIKIKLCYIIILKITIEPNVLNIKYIYTNDLFCNC